MKRVLILLAAIMLFSAPAMAANTITYKGPQGQGASQGQMQNVVNQTNVRDSQLINNGTGNAMRVGGITNQ